MSVSEEIERLQAEVTEREEQAEESAAAGKKKP